MSLIVSLTSHGSRVKTVHLVIESLKCQSYKPDKVILWLNKEEFSSDNLPEELSVLQDELFEIRFCTDLKSFTKLVPALKAFPASTIITVDDDSVYHQDLVASMWGMHRLYPKSIISPRARLLRRNGNDFAPYDKWLKMAPRKNIYAKFCLLPLGFGGVLYPVNSLHADVIREDIFLRVSPHGDDLWFKAMSLLNGTATVFLANKELFNRNIISGTQSIGLWRTINSDPESNLIQMRKIIGYYPILSSVFSSKRYNKVRIF